MRLDSGVSGPGEIVAADHGDATSHLSFQSPTRNAFNGLALVIVRTQPGQTGGIVVKAKYAGLQFMRISLNNQ